MRDVLDLRWPVCTGQYRWVDAFYNKPSVTRDPDDPTQEIIEYSAVMVRALVYPRDAPGAREYLPLRREPTLFMTFAETEATEEGILAFADRFGALGVKPQERLTPALPDQERKRFSRPSVDRGRLVLAGPAELFDVWKGALWSMRLVVGLWQIIRRGDPEEIARHIKWRQHETGRQELYYHVDTSVPPPKEGQDGNYICIGYFSPNWNPLNLRYGEAIRPARLYVASKINMSLESKVSPYLVFGADDDTLRLHFAPRNLIGALWLQFSLAVAGNSDFRPCRECGKLFEVSRTAARSDRLFCSDACRVKAYRDRREEARRLFAGGKSVKEIAEALGAKAKAVEGWVKGTEDKE